MDALEGLQVLDLCRGYPPAFATMFLADFGAEVIKIDPVGYINPLRPENTTDRAWAAYSFWDRKKKSIKINFRSEKGREIIHKLAKTADVFMENSRPGTMQRLAIDYPALQSINPRLIYCSVSGYGQNGPYRDLVGHDSNYIAVTGAMSLIGPKDGPPCMPSLLLSDIAGSSLHSLIGILLALAARERNGKGQFVDISYTDAVFSMLGWDMATYLLTGAPRRRGQTLQTGSEPCSAVYRTKDGEYVAIQFIEAQFWANFCRHIDRPDLIERQWPKGDEEKQELAAFLQELFLTRTREEWWQWAQDKQVMLGPVRYLEEAMADPHFKQRKMALEIDEPGLGKIFQIGNPFKLSGTPPSLRGISPDPGQHTEEILKKLDYDQDQIEAMKRNGIVE
ncbi:CaiB/BaiF CoA transferase family protein [Chloroflexota bacterium]